MIQGIKTIDDFELKGKIVLLRVDINSPIDHDQGRIKDDTRLRRSAPTIKELAELGARTVVLAHQADPMDYQNFTTLDEHAEYLRRLTGLDIRFVEDVAGPAAREAISALKDGEVLLLDNVRIHTEETISFEKEVALTPDRQTKTVLVRRLAPLGDVYLCDAFAAVHRSEPTLVAFQRLMPSGCGRLFEEELRVLGQVREAPKRPSVFMLGGAKILDAFSMMENVLQNGSADRVLCVGLVGQIMLAAAGVDMGAASMDFIRAKQLEKFIEPAKRMLARYGDRILYPEDVATVDDDGARRETDVAHLPVNDGILDIGAKTIARFSEILSGAGTIFMNGPAGVYEKDASAEGTRALWQAVGASPGFSVIGGGDTIAAARKFGVTEQISYVCTAGGGLVLYLSGKPLAVIEAFGAE